VASPVLLDELLHVGDQGLDLGQGGDGGSGFPVGTEGGRGRVGKAQEFFAKKLPRTKLEELAVAARYREDRDGTTSSSKAELEAIFKEARKNFDSKHYRRDLENAKQAGLFTRAPAKEGASLSDYGLKYVDALPDREAAKALVRPKKGKARGKKKRT